jgi:hypothetical protein
MKFSIKHSLKPNLKTTFSTLILTLAPLFLTQLPSYGAGGGGGTTTDNGTGTNTGSPITTTNPLSNGVGGLNSSGTNSYSSGSYNFGSYSSGSSCGVQAYLNTNYGNGNASSPISTSQTQNNSNSSSILNGTTTINTLTIGAGIIFNSQKCLDPRKQLETQERIQTNQTQSQLKQTSIQICGPQRTELVKANPTITKERLDEICPL